MTDPSSPWPPPPTPDPPRGGPGFPPPFAPGPRPGVDERWANGFGWADPWRAAGGHESWSDDDHHDDHRGHRRRGRGGRGRPPWATGGPGAFFGPGGVGGPGGFGGPRGFGRRGRRRNRGDIRAAILALLAEHPMHGYQIIQQLSERTGGSWRPSPGSVYPTLQNLEDVGLIRGREADGRKVFELTTAGREVVDQTTGPAPWESAAGPVDDEVAGLQEAAVQLAGSVVQVAQAGNPDQIERATRLLDEARRSLYRILAEDEAEAPADPTDPAT